MQKKAPHLIKLVSHYFNYHLSEEQQMSDFFTVRFLKIYFIFTVMKNTYLANFELYGKKIDDVLGDERSSFKKREGFIEINQRLLYQRYLD